MRAFGLRHLPAVLLVALLIAAYAAFAPAHTMFQWDEAEYATLGRSLLRGDGFSIAGTPNYYRLPIVPAAVAVALVLSGSERDAVVLRVTLAFAGVALLLVYAFAAAEYGRLTGLAATALLGMQPAFWGSTPFLLTEIPFLAFFGAALFGFHRGLARDPRWLMASAAFAAVALHTRYTGALIAPLALVFFVAWVGLRGRGAFDVLRRRELWLAIALGFVLLAPWLIRQWVVFGDALTGLRYASGQLSEYMPDVAMPWWFYPAHFLEMTSPLVATLALVGAGLAVYRRDSLAIFCLLAVVFILIWFSMYRFKEIRQVTSMQPFVAVLAAYGLTRVLDESVPRRALCVVAVLSVGLALTAWAQRPGERVLVTRGYPSFLHAMEHLKQSSQPSDRILGEPAPQIAWYADRLVSRFPPDRDDLETALTDTQWVVVTGFEPGQPAYAIELLAGLEQSGRWSEARPFRDRRFWTALVPSSSLRSLSARTAEPSR